jgi:ABC-type branched-subunit amino acid transport system substrate-binding protein
MRLSRKKRGAGLLIVAVVAGLVAALLTPAAGGATTPAAKTVTNGTINVAGLGYAANYGDAAIGAQARFKRANDDNEVKGYKFQWAEFADDKNDPATALSETRRLVTQDDIFSLIDVSLATPGDYLTQQQIPWFGPGYDATYCPDAGVKGWGFSIYGCILRENAKRAYGSTFTLMKNELATKGVTKPSIALIGTDAQSGKAGITQSASAAQGAGFNVVYAKGTIPAPPAVVGDYSPYIQAMLTSNNGGQPSVIYSQAPPSISLSLFNGLKAAGFTGTILSPYYSKLLLKPLAGSYVFLQFAGYETQSAGVDQFKADVEAFKPGTPGSLTLAGGYFAADMLIQSVKAALKSNKTLTTASVQKAASNIKYYIKNTIGPTNYPASYNIPNQACNSLEFDADGSAFSLAQPYTCTTKTYPILPKFKSGLYPS